MNDLQANIIDYINQNNECIKEYEELCQKLKSLFNKTFSNCTEFINYLDNINELFHKEINSKKDEYIIEMLKKNTTLHKKEAIEDNDTKIEKQNIPVENFFKMLESTEKNIESEDDKKSKELKRETSEDGEYLKKSRNYSEISESDKDIKRSRFSKEIRRSRRSSEEYDKDIKRYRRYYEESDSDEDFKSSREQIKKLDDTENRLFNIKRYINNKIYIINASKFDPPDILYHRGVMLSSYYEKINKFNPCTQNSQTEISLVSKYRYYIISAIAHNENHIKAKLRDYDEVILNFTDALNDTCLVYTPTFPSHKTNYKGKIAISLSYYFKSKRILDYLDTIDTIKPKGIIYNYTQSGLIFR